MPEEPKSPNLRRRLRPPQLRDGLDEEDSPVPSPTESPRRKPPLSGKHATWEHHKVADAQGWHTPVPSSPTKSEAGDARVSGASGPLTPGGVHISKSDTSLSSKGTMDMFRMADQVARKTFESPYVPSPDNKAGGKRQLGTAMGPHGERLIRSSSMPEVGEIMRASITRSSQRQHGILRGNVSHGMSMAEFAVRREGKLLLAMVGLPARGKTYIAQSIKRHMDWLGMRTETYNAGNYRRQVVGKETPATFFDPKNEEGARLRSQCAEAALADALKKLSNDKDNLYIAIFDATNTTKKRRDWLRKVVNSHPSHIQLTFVETVLTDEEQVWENVRESKLKSPDYLGKGEEEAMKDFFERIDQYKSVYEPVEKGEGSSFIRLTNAGEELLGYKVGGYASGRVMQLIDSMRLTLRPIMLTRCGESEHDAKGIMGGDSTLTAVGSLYGEALRESIRQVWGEKGKAKPVIWTSTHLRARQTVAGLSDEFPVLELSALDEIDTGAVEGMTVSEFAAKYPWVYEARQADKLRTKFPGGENYLDMFNRLEHLLLELIAEPEPVIIVAHLAVLRVVYGYLKGTPPEECPYLDVPMNCVIRMIPKGYGYEEWRHLPTMPVSEGF